MALRCFPFSTVDSCSLPFFPAEPEGWAHLSRIGWGTGNTGSTGITGSSECFLRRGMRRKALRYFPFSTVDSCFLPFFPAEPKGRARMPMIGWGTGNTGNTGNTGSSGYFLRRGARGKALANSPFFARALSVLLVFPVLPELGLQSVPGRAGMM